jgi:hypothetical protein
MGAGGVVMNFDQTDRGVSSHYAVLISLGDPDRVGSPGDKPGISWIACGDRWWA